MLMGESLPFICHYIAAVNETIKRQNPENQLAQLQSDWLAFMLLGLLMTHSFYWVQFEQFGFGITR